MVQPAPSINKTYSYFFSLTSGVYVGNQVLKIPIKSPVKVSEILHFKIGNPGHAKSLNIVYKKYLTMYSAFFYMVLLRVCIKK